MKEKRNEIVTHHNYLNESVLNLSELELNLFIIILYKMKNKSDKTVLFDVKDIKNIIGSKDRSYKAFEKLTHSLQDKTIYLKTLEGYDRIKPFPLLSFNTTKNTVKIKIDDSLEPLIKNLTEQFTRYSLQEFLSLKSKHSKRLFQLLKQYERIGNRSFNLDQLKEYLECNTKSYERMFNFEKKVLSKARDEINEKTNLKISYEKIKVGKFIRSINFNIKSVNKNISSNILEIKVKEEQGINDERLEIDRAILRAKKNIYISKSWNKRVDNKINKIIKEEGDRFTINLLDELYRNLKQEVKTTLVQYINGILNKIKEDKDDIKLKGSKFKSIEDAESLKVKSKSFEIKMSDIKKEKISENLIELAIEKCIEIESGMNKQFLKDMRKRSETIFINTIKKYL